MVLISEESRGGDHLDRTGVREFYRGKTVLVTGATGFVGKILVEKLLRCCPDIQQVFLLMRAKRGDDVKSRFKQYVGQQVFSVIRQECPSVLSKLTAIGGDILAPALGLSAADSAQLMRSVQVVFHCAANVRFDLSLRTAVLMNTGGTLKVLDLAVKMEQLEVFLHVSTSYCHCDEQHLQEKTYEPKVAPRELLAAFKWMSDDCLAAITPILLGDLPNTYAFSKNLSEGLIQEYGTRMRIGISRPSIVVNAWREPLPGFIDNLNGPVGLLVAAGKGVLRSMHCKPHYLADTIPVDFAVNTIIGQAWRMAVDKSLPSPWTVHACVSSNHVTWRDVIETNRKHFYLNPFSTCVWYPDGSIKSNRLAHEFCVVFYHFLPAYVIDAVLALCRQKTFMVNLQRRIQGGLQLLQYYTTKKWTFSTNHVREIRAAMPADERDIFYTDMDLIKWEDYFLDSVLGTRLYCLKEDPATLPQARRQLNRLYWLDQALCWLFYAVLVYLCFLSLAPVWDLTERALAPFSSSFLNLSLSSNI